MQDASDQRTLSSIAEDAAFSMSDVAFISGLEESTVYRLWDNPSWLDKISGRSLQALIATVPGLGDYVARYSIRSRRAKLLEDLAVDGLDINEAAISRCVAAGIPEQYITAALQAAVHIMRCDNVKASSYLARFWGAGQDRALTALFSPSAASGLLKNSGKLIAASAELAAHLERKGYSFHTIITQAVFGHYIGKAIGQSPALPEIVDRQTAFTYRSSVMGLLISTNDRELAEQYRENVKSTPVLRTIEEWSFPTYTRDTRPNSDFTLPRSLLLRNTAQEILSEIRSGEYGEAYIAYLVSTYLPIALRRDPTFGLSLGELRSALLAYREQSTDKEIKAICESLAKKIRDLRH